MKAVTCSMVADLEAKVTPEEVETLRSLLDRIERRNTLRDDSEMEDDTTKQRTRPDAPSEFPHDPAELEGLRELARRLREDPEADLFQPGIRFSLGPAIVIFPRENL